LNGYTGPKVWVDRIATRRQGCGGINGNGSHWLAKSLFYVSFTLDIHQLSSSVVNDDGGNQRLLPNEIVVQAAACMFCVD